MNKIKQFINNNIYFLLSGTVISYNIITYFENNFLFIDKDNCEYYLI